MLLDDVVLKILKAVGSDSLNYLDGRVDAGGRFTATLQALDGDGCTVLRVFTGPNAAELIIDAVATTAGTGDHGFPAGPRQGEAVWACWWCAQLCTCRKESCDCRYSVPVDRTDNTGEFCDGYLSMLLADGRRICKYHYDAYHENCADEDRLFEGPRPALADSDDEVDPDEDCECRYCVAARPEPEEDDEDGDEEDDDEEGVSP